jgi:IPT/TIG domain
VLFAATLGACLATAPQGIHRQTDDDGGGGGGGDGQNLGGATTESPPDNPLPDASAGDPHAVFGAEPAHGPFVGGGRVLLHGRGFSSKARVWFGDLELDAKAVLPVDPSRLQLISPPGAAGAVDVTVQNGDDTSTRRTLPGGYAYDALYAEPASGPVSGGTVITLRGQGTSFGSDTTVKIDQKPCAAVEIKDLNTLVCTAPPGSPGGKTIAVTSPTTSILVLDAYTYEDSDNGYKGGLSGDKLAGHLRVLAFDNYSGDPIPFAGVIAGVSLPDAKGALTDKSGVAVVSDPSLAGPTTITVAAKCHSPVTFVDVPVDTVTVYLDPELSPACASAGDPPPVGGKSSYAGVVKGELVWPTQGEFGKGAWSNVPTPIGTKERRAAYLFPLQSDPTSPFQLPSAQLAVTEASPGDLGYGFTLTAGAGNRSFYALAGIEDRSKSPPRFTAYAMGVVKGVPVTPGETTKGVFIPIATPLDQALTLTVASPAPGPKGPDRLRATVAVHLGSDGYALLPIGQQTPLLPVRGPVTFVGVPPLDGPLTGATYLATARAQTGPAGAAPLSVLGRLITNNTSKPLAATGFVNVPTLVLPAVNAAWDDRHLAASFAPGGSPVDLTVYDIVSGGGLLHWTVAVPAGPRAVEVPDLRALPAGFLPPGPLSIAVYGARIDGFDYGKLRYQNLRPAGMTAYSLDYFGAHL